MIIKLEAESPSAWRRARHERSPAAPGYRDIRRPEIPIHAFHTALQHPQLHLRDCRKPDQRNTLRYR
jgi:hypothetical protein